MTTTKSRFRANPALVVSFAALFIAMSGAAIALPGQNSVNSGDVANNRLRSVDLRDNAAVASVDVIDETLATNDVAPDTLTADDLAPNSVNSSEIADDAVTSSEIANDAVGSTEIAANAVQSSEIDANAVGSSELADDSVRAAELGDGIQPRYNSILVNGGAAENGAYVTESVTASCQAGEELISGSGEWVSNANGDELFLSEIILNHNAESVTVTGGNDSGSNRTLYAAAHCL